MSFYRKLNKNELIEVIENQDRRIDLLIGSIIKLGAELPEYKNKGIKGFFKKLF